MVWINVRWTIKLFVFHYSTELEVSNYRSNCYFMIIKTFMSEIFRC
jgi:hypothetical protein